MRYVLLLLTILTAGLSVWYYQHKITPEGEDLAARKQAMEEAAVTLQQAVNESRTKLNNAQDATRDAELAVEKFQAHYLDKKRQQHQEEIDASYRKAMEDQQEEVNDHNQKMELFRRRAAKQRENIKSAREELLQKKEQMRGILAQLTDKQRSIQKELADAERDALKSREDSKNKKKSAPRTPSQKVSTEALQAQLGRIRQAIAGTNEKIRQVDADLTTQEEKAAKQELRMQNAEKKLTEQKDAALADEKEEKVPDMMDLTDDDLLATAEYREQSKTVREAFARAQKEEAQASQAYDRARAAMGRASKEELADLNKQEKGHASFQKLFTGTASVVGFILLLFTVGAFRRSNG